jgi:hypothetical protein
MGPMSSIEKPGLEQPNQSLQRRLQGPPKASLGRERNALGRTYGSVPPRVGSALNHRRQYVHQPQRTGLGASALGQEHLGLLDLGSSAIGPRAERDEVGIILSRPSAITRHLRSPCQAVEAISCPRTHGLVRTTRVGMSNRGLDISCETLHSAAVGPRPW